MNFVFIIDGIALVGDYAKYATEQKAEADRWRKWTIRLGITAAATDHTWSNQD